MKSSISNYRNRAGLTQQAIADMFYVDKSAISHIENGTRNITGSMYNTGFNNATDAELLSDMAYEVTGGYTAPTPSNRVYDDHRMSIKHRAKREIQEFMDATTHHYLDKHPEYLTDEEKETIHEVYSEAQDVLFEIGGFITKLSNDYDFLEPQRMNESRDARLRMERRI